MNLLLVKVLKFTSMDVPVTACIIPGAVEICFLNPSPSGWSTSPVMGTGRQTNGSCSAIERGMLVTLRVQRLLGHDVWNDK